MRFVPFLSLFLFFGSAVSAQRFYYFETTNLVDRLISSGLEKSDQYVVPSVVGSEYTVRTKVQSGDAHELNLEITLADSVTQKEIFRSTAQFCYANGVGQPEYSYESAVRAFLRRRIGDMIHAARQDHDGLFSHELRARRDKT